MQYVFYHWSLNHRALKWADNNGIEIPLWYLQHFLRRYMPHFISIWLIVGVTKQKNVASRPTQNLRIWWNEIVKQTFNDNQWIENFRMRKEIFTFLCNQLGQLLKCDWDKHAKVHLEIDQKAVIALKLLTSSPEYCTLGKLFGTLESSVCKLCSYVTFVRQ